MKNRIGHLAGDHICFIRIGDGDQHVGIFRTGAFQYLRVGSIAVNGTNVDMIL